MSDYRAVVPVGPPPEPPRGVLLFPLALVVDGVDVVATRSRRLYVVRGLLGIFLLPALFALLVGLLHLGLGFDDEPLIAIFLMVLTPLAVVWGLALIALSGVLSRRRAVRFDRARGVVAQGSLQLPFSGLELRIRKLEGLSGWMVIEAVHGGRAITIHDRLQPMHARDVAAHAAYLGELSAAPVHGLPQVAAQKHLISDNTAAMLCYLPFQGIHLIASLYYLFAARDRPFVRFAAKQSLVQLGFTLVALIVFGAGFGVPLALVMDGERELTTAGIVLVVLLSVSLATVAIGNLIAHIVACVRAMSGRLWVMPWLRGVVSPPSDRPLSGDGTSAHPHTL